jgi:putative SOS response-associated peptidase YedK
MCGRFTASFEFREIKLLLNLQRDIPLFARRYNIAPSQEIPVTLQNDGVNELKPMKWGLIPSWAPDPSIGNNMINARVETITERPSYRRLIESKRCLIPADGFYEWRREGNSKVPVWFHLKKNSRSRSLVFGICGGMSIGEILHSFTIITTVPNACCDAFTTVCRGTNQE